MIITRTPYRISLFGGGSDFPSWYLKEGGKVVAFSIDKFCYLTVRKLPPFFDHKYRVSYSKTEEVVDINKIAHPAFREGIRLYNYGEPVEIHHHGDLPARSGIGTSSAFAVGLISALKKLNGESFNQIDTANEAIKFEQNILKENVGSQDQITCALGGFNSIEFFSNGSWALNKINLSTSLTREIEDRSVLIYTGISRISSELSKNLKEGRDINLRAMRRTIQLAEESIKIFKDNKNLDEIGLMLQEGWSLKQEINPLSYNFQVQEIINRAQKAGALGGKVLGAGGGGFCLLWLKKDSKKDFLEKFRSSLVVPFSIDNAGTKIIFEST
jgi:D-glycero-alpha-D-manno-heptose-7-phosphate kinase